MIPRQNPILRQSRTAQLLTDVLLELGEDPQRPGLLETPRRWAESLLEMTSGGGEPEALKHLKFFPVLGYPGEIEIKDIPFYSTCEHHLLPFWGTVTIVYAPKEHIGILGLSKFPRIINCFARQLQTQENLTYQIKKFLFDYLSDNVYLDVEAQHACICSRGVNREGIKTRTTA